MGGCSRFFRYRGLKAGQKGFLTAAAVPAVIIAPRQTGTLQNDIQVCVYSTAYEARYMYKAKSYKQAAAV